MSCAKLPRSHVRQVRVSPRDFLSNRKIGSTQLVKEKMKITGRHILAARDFLGITQAELAQFAGVDEATVRHLELGRHRPRATTLAAICKALEDRGIEFLNGGEPGIRLRPSKAVIPVERPI